MNKTFAAIAAISAALLAGGCSAEAETPKAATPTTSTIPAAPTLNKSDMIGARKLVEKTCKEAVSKQLKSPSSVKWVDVETTNSDAAGTRWTVAGDMDSQNSFGAMIRGAFGCSATYDIAAESTVVRVEFAG